MTTETKNIFRADGLPKNVLRKKQNSTYQLTAARNQNGGIDPDANGVFTFSVSSETPVDMFFGPQVLRHTSDAVDMNRLNDGAPVLWNHNPDEQIGVVQKAFLDGDRLMTSVRFSQNARGQEVARDIQDGIIRNVSIRATVNDMEKQAPATENDPPTFVVTRWMPVEISIVSIPADASVGIGRSLDDDETPNVERSDVEPDPTDPKEPTEPVAEEVSRPFAGFANFDACVLDMKSKGHDDASAHAMCGKMQADAEQAMPKDVACGMTDSQASPIVIEQRNMLGTETPGLPTEQPATPVTTEVRKMDKELVRQLTDLATKNKMTDKLSDWLTSERSLESVKAEILDAMATKPETVSAPAAPAVHTSPKVQSFGEAVRAWVGGENSEIAERGLDERRKAGQPVNPGALYVPMTHPVFDINVVARMAGKTPDVIRSSIAGTGVNATGKLYLSFEETLREIGTFAKAGGQIITANDPPVMPYFSAPSTASMAAETGSVSATDAEVGKVSWAFQRIVARLQYSTLLQRLNGTYDYEAELTNDVLAELNFRLEKQVWGGTGANNITGILYNTNIHEFGNTGSFALNSGSAIIKNVDNRFGNSAAGVWVVSAGVWSDIFARAAFTNAAGSVLDRLAANNRVLKSAVLPTFISSSNAAIFGDFGKVTTAIVGGVELTRDNLTGLASGKMILNAEMFADCQVRQPAVLEKWTGIIVP